MNIVTQSPTSVARSEDPTKQAYVRQVLQEDASHEVLIMHWIPDVWCLPHDHGDAVGCVHLIEGRLRERTYRFDGRTLQIQQERTMHAPAMFNVTPGDIHDMCAIGPAITVHRYMPKITGMRVFVSSRRETIVVPDHCGAWVPEDEGTLLDRRPWLSALPPTEPS